MKTVIIADDHSSRNPGQKVTLELQNGGPYFNYIWIDDICYIVRKSSRGKTVCFMAPSAWSQCPSEIKS